MLKPPILIINLKEYEQALGEKPIIFAKIARKLSDKHKINIILSPPAPLLNEVAKIALTVSQHIDPYEPGAHTGALLAKEVKELGAIGSLINHSEKRIPHEDIGKCVDLCREYELISIVCAKDNNEVKELAMFKPDFIAIEPPELIGGNVSVSTARPEIVKNSVKDVKKISPRTHVFCGAGIKTREDVEKAIELGAIGVILASGVVKSGNVERSIEELVMGMK